MMWSLIPNWLKIGAVGVVCAFALASGTYWIGKRDGRFETQVDSAKDAINRMNRLEKNNAAFRDLTLRHRCLVFMRDSKLPESACD